MERRSGGVNGRHPVRAFEKTYIAAFNSKHAEVQERAYVDELGSHLIPKKGLK